MVARNGGDEPAEISQAEWDVHSGELARVGGVVGSLGEKLDRTTRNLTICIGEMKTMGPRLAALDKRLRERDARLDKLDDWKEDTGSRELARLERELADKRAADRDDRIEGKKRFWFWAKIVGGVLVAAGDALVHWLQAVK